MLTELVEPVEPGQTGILREDDDEASATVRPGSESELGKRSSDTATLVASPISIGRKEADESLVSVSEEKAEEKAGLKQRLKAAVAGGSAH